MEVLRVAILDFCKRRKGKSFCPSEVVRQIFPEDWRIFMPDVQKVMLEMYQEGIIEVTQKGLPVPPEKIPVGPVRISPVKKLY
jgi:methyl coenzyme M reductase subunit D